MSKIKRLFQTTLVVLGIIITLIGFATIGPDLSLGQVLMIISLFPLSAFLFQVATNERTAEEFLFAIILIGLFSIFSMSGVYELTRQVFYLIVAYGGAGIFLLATVMFLIKIWRS
jgi:mannitol-specific phosphotransferase system IIBC component